MHQTGRRQPKQDRQDNAINRQREPVLVDPAGVDIGPLGRE